MSVVSHTPIPHVALPICNIPSYADLENLLLVNKGTSILAHVHGPKPPKEVEARIIAFLIPHFSDNENAFYRYMRVFYTEKITQKFNFLNIKSTFSLLDLEWKARVDQETVYISAIITRNLIFSLLLNWKLPILAPSYEEYRAFHEPNQAPLRAFLKYRVRIIEVSLPYREETCGDFIKSVNKIPWYRLDGLKSVIDGWNCISASMSISSSRPIRGFIRGPIPSCVDPITKKIVSIFPCVLGCMLALRVPLEIFLRSFFSELWLDDGPRGLPTPGEIPIILLEFCLGLSKIFLLTGLLAKVLPVPLVSSAISLSTQTVLAALIGCFVIHAIALFAIMPYHYHWHNQPYCIRFRKIAHCMLIKHVQNTWKRASAAWKDRHETSKWFAHIPQLFRDYRAAIHCIGQYKAPYWPNQASM